jgi:transposase InsO family protein
MSIENERREFASLALCEGSNIRSLCRRFGISPTTAYKWMGRARQNEPFSDQSRRPKSSPLTTTERIEQLVIATRTEYPTWGGRKLVSFLKHQGHQNLPSPSTVTEILRRHNLLNENLTGPRDWVRFEKELPNELWQMDFKGHFELQNGKRCHPFTVLDDHSRYSIQARACPGETGKMVWEGLTDAFRIYGLPQKILCDNGGPWATQAAHGLTRLTVKLVLYGIEVGHGEPYHPQTQGKLERWHRTLKADLIQRRTYSDVDDFQKALDDYRIVYNTLRPHEALDMKPPIKAYTASSRTFSEKEPEPFFDKGMIIRKVSDPGRIAFKGRRFLVSDALIGYPVGLRETDEDGVYDVVFCGRIVSQVNLRYNSKDHQ